MGSKTHRRITDYVETGTSVLWVGLQLDRVGIKDKWRHRTDSDLFTVEVHFFFNDGFGIVHTVIHHGL